MQQCIKILLFLVLHEAQHVSGDTPPIIRSLKLHKQPLVLRKWRVVGRAVFGRCQAAYAVIKFWYTVASCWVFLCKNNTVFSDVTLCSLVSALRRFGGNVCILLHGVRRWRLGFRSELGKLLMDYTSQRTKGQQTWDLRSVRGLTQRRIVAFYGRFATTYWSHLEAIRAYFI